MAHTTGAAPPPHDPRPTAFRSPPISERHTNHLPDLSRARIRCRPIPRRHLFQQDAQTAPIHWPPLTSGHRRTPRRRASRLRGRTKKGGTLSVLSAAAVASRAYYQCKRRHDRLFGNARKPARFFLVLRICASTVFHAMPRSGRISSASATKACRRFAIS